MSRRRIVCLVGPTASGKSALAMAVAERLPIEIVSADSRQVYRGLDVGTAKPSAAERARVPHHGLDLVEPTATYDAGRFAALATEAIGAAHARGRHVLVVGGTGLYVRALLHGLAPMPGRAPALRRVLLALAERDGTARLHDWLVRLDPPVAARVHANDAVRIVRALEVVLSSGRRLSWWQARRGTPAPWDALLLALDVPPATLDARIATRVVTMCRSGWLDEVDRLRATVPPWAPAWRTVGYRELRRHLEGAYPLATAQAAVVLATRQFAKRQRTWFRHQPGVVWRDASEASTAIVDEVIAHLAPASA